MRTVLCVQALVCLAIGCSSPPSPRATPPEPAPTTPAPACDVSLVETVPADDTP